MSEPYRYFAYGLIIDSAIELPELGRHLDRQGKGDLRIRIGDVARFGTERGGSQGGTRWIDPQHFWLHVDGVAHFLVARGQEITVKAEAQADPSVVRAFLLGSAFGAMLVQRGFLVLHGNAIRVGDACLVCVGESGAGKSTLAAGFLKRGFQVLADDVVAIDSHGCAIPGFPRIKLWQDAADQLGYSTEGRPRVAPHLEKFNLPIIPFDSHERLPVRWVYELTNGDVDAVRIEPVSGLQRFRRLRDNTYRNEYLDGQGMLSGHLKQCSQMAGRVHLSSVVRPSSGFLLDALIESLLGDVASCGDASGEA